MIFFEKERNEPGGKILEKEQGTNVRERGGKPNRTEREEEEKK
jgi:hypothetical protein